jgi:beta-glucosidase/6-phospho-beta-glucosidase/beta-galactosidase
MSSTDSARRAFPEGFVWGAATAGHQIEGNNVNSDFWFLEFERSPKPSAAHPGAIARRNEL